MPALYIAFHLLAGLLCFYLVGRVQRRPGYGAAIGIAALLLLTVGFAIERRPDWAWRLMSCVGTGLLFLTNVAFEAVTTLFALMWWAAARREERLRSVLLALPLLAAALWSYAWYFEPLPPGINGQVDRIGFCRQSTSDSCSAAAAVMFLRLYGIATTEAEMAQDCLTRAGKGTSPLGLYRGLALKAEPHGLRLRVVQMAPEQLRSLKQPVIINVGLKANTPWETSNRLQSYGWQVGSWHTVVVLSADADGKGADVADPNNGIERWPVGDLKYLWDGLALTLAPR